MRLSRQIYWLRQRNFVVIAKGKDHKQYEYGNKVSIVSTKDNNIIVGVVSHDKNIHDSKTLDAAITHARLVEQEVFLISFKQAVCGKFALQFSDEFVFHIFFINLKILR
jgi:IS5 family transposase